MTNPRTSHVTLELEPSCSATVASISLAWAAVQLTLLTRQRRRLQAQPSLYAARTPSMSLWSAAVRFHSDART